MKIEVNEDQPLDEIVGELERLGYKQVGVSYIFRGSTFVCTNKNGYYVCLKKPAYYCKKTTLAELKEM